MARALQGLEDGTQKTVSTKKPKTSANANVTIKPATVKATIKGKNDMLSILRLLHHFLINFPR